MIEPNGSDDTEQIKLALDYGTTEPRAVKLGHGRFNWYGDYAPKANKKLYGLSENHATTLIVHGKIILDGDVRGANGWSFQNTLSDMMIEGDESDCFLSIGRSYNNRIENIWFHRIKGKFGHISGGNNTAIRNVRIWGEDRPQYGLDISGGSTFMNQVNIEGYGRDGHKGGALNYRGGVVGVNGLYIERSSIPICIDNGINMNTDQLVITGGLVRGLDSEVEVAVHDSHNVLIQGLSLENMKSRHKVYFYGDRTNRVYINNNKEFEASWSEHKYIGT